MLTIPPSYIRRSNNSNNNTKTEKETTTTENGERRRDGDERGRNIFETFSSNDMSFLVEWSIWDKYERAPWRQESSASASDGWRREVLEQLVVSWVERLLWPENLAVSLKYVLKHATRRGSNILAEPLRGKQKTMVGKSGKRRCAAGEWAKRVRRP